MVSSYRPRRQPPFGGCGGIVLCILAVCGMFINLQLISTMLVSGAYDVSSAEQIAANGEIIAGMYVGSMLIAFIGSIVIGLIARLPLAQVSGLGLSTVMISLVGTSTGLSYYNLLAVCFVSSILYAVAVSLPPVKKFLFNVLPRSVRKAIPAALGILLAFMAMQLSGLISVSDSALPVFGVGEAISSASSNMQLSGLIGFSLYDYSSDRFHPTLLLAAIFCVVLILLVLVFKSRKRSVGAGHEYQAQPAVRAEFRIFFGGSAPVGKDGRGICQGHSEKRDLCLHQAFCGE